MSAMNSMAAPHAGWEYGLVAGALIILVWVLYLGVRFTLWPGEESPHHIKRKILEGDAPARPAEVSPRDRDGSSRPAGESMA